MSLCPSCMKNNINSLLTNIGIINKILICENDDCPYVESDEKPNNNLLDLDYTTNELKNENNNDITLSEDNSSDVDLDISSTDSENENLQLKNKVNLTKYSINTVQRHLKILIKEGNQIPPVLNWFGFPLMIKFHVKICYFLIIQLNLFDYHKHLNISELKEMYYKCEDMASKIPRRLVTLISYKFMKFLYDEHNVFNLANFNHMEMTERILKSMEKFITSLDNHDKYKSIYSYKEICLGCSYKINYFKEDFSMKISYNFHYLNNGFTFTSQCKKCFGVTEISMQVERLANFIFLEFPKGVNKTFDELKAITLVKRFHNDLKLQAIIELKCPLPITDIPEKPPQINEFVMKKVSKHKLDHRISFCNTEGWFCIDSDSGYVIKTITESEVQITSSNIRLLVFAERNDPRDVRWSDLSVSLSNELNEYKNPPPGSIMYPSDNIKYWIMLFKYRDYCLTKSNLTKSFILKMSTKITARLNYHLKKRQNRRNNKIKNALNDEDQTESQNLQEVEEYFGEDRMSLSSDGHDEITEDTTRSEPKEVSFSNFKMKIEESCSQCDSSVSNPPQDGGKDVEVTGNCIVKPVKKVETVAPPVHTNVDIVKGRLLDVIISKMQPQSTSDYHLDGMIEAKKRRINEKFDNLPLP